MRIDAASVQAFPEFAHLGDHSIDDLRTHLRPVHLRAGDTLFAQGQRDGALYLLVEGTVDIVQTPEDGPGPGQLRSVAARRAPAVLGELAMLLDVPRTASVVASTDALCWQLSRDAFSSGIERSEAWAARLALAIAAELARRLVDARSEITQLGPTHKPAELAQLRTRLLADWAF